MVDVTGLWQILGIYLDFLPVVIMLLLIGVLIGLILLMFKAAGGKSKIADKLFILKIDEAGEEPRQLVAGLRGHYEAEELKGKQIAFLANLEPRLLRGQMSKGMILAASDGENPYAILTVDRKVNNNAKVS